MFEHQIGLLAVRLADVVDGDHMGTLHPAQGAAFGDEPFTDLRVQAVVLREDFDHHAAVQPLIGGTVDRGEGPYPHHTFQPKVVQPLRHHWSSTSPAVCSRAATIARPRLTCDFTVPRDRPNFSATSA